jgi:GH43 family beta-xylosidase
MKQLSYTNPVYCGYFADPFVWWSGEGYCAIGTGEAEAAGETSSAKGPSVFPLLHSRDLVNWEPAGRALVRGDPAWGDSYWAPEVAYAEGRWYLYYSVGHGDRRHQLRVAVSPHALGPYHDMNSLTDPDQVPFAIDPHPFCDEDGRWYLFHARDFLELFDDEGREARAGTALVIHPLARMTELEPRGRTVARARCDWQRFAANRPMYGRMFDWHTMEGPCVIRHDGRYFCLYSGGCWQTDTYGVDFVVADDVMGPYFDQGAESGPRVLRTVPGHVLGPGHCSVVTGPDGLTTCLVYHAWGPDMQARRMFLDPLLFTPQGPRCPGPTWTRQPFPAR